MDSLFMLFEQFSPSSIIIIPLLLLLGFKGINEVLEYWYNKLCQYFHKKNWRDEKNNKLCNSIDNLSNKIDNLNGKIEILDERVGMIEDKLNITQEGLLENTRSRLIDARNKFCYQIKAIDDYSLSSLEREYLYYTKLGGNTFMDCVMNDIRQLPIINCNTAILRENETQEEKGEL